ncbi:MAG: 5-(carboxyamino)imidazole ribonucleotide synthase [Segetibacter sp.]|nr:5-(carboxyamino)imidazole ribonucleotide synthase [Segetibacter sp.]
MASVLIKIWYVEGSNITTKLKNFLFNSLHGIFALHLLFMKAGILGGGQLGRMLLQAAINYPVETFVMENDPECPSAHLCHHFIQGNIQDYDAVYNFGQGLDVITIEIEAVNVEALEQLEREGVKICPKPSAIKIIKNKIDQKEFYKENGIPSSAFIVTNSLQELQQHLSFLPAAHKVATGGYDGRGVQLMRTEADTAKGFDAPAVLEKMVDVKQELAVIVAMNEKGETAIYPPSEMMFDPILNQLDFQICPAKLSDTIIWKAEAFAVKVVQQLNSPGIFAVEIFVDYNDEVWVNETAPRVHNSGHHTIEANYSSQFDMLWRIMLGYPLGNTEPILASAIVNVVGAEGHNGPVSYEGLQDVLKLDNVFVHLYGKKDTKPGRKMGHVTILSNEHQELIHQANKIKNLLKVVAV